MVLPSLHDLPLGDRGKVANVPNRGRLADLPLELWQRIQHFLVEDCSLDSLLWISSWCTTHSKVCDDQWSKGVLETCFGARPEPVVPSTPDTDMIRRMGLDIFDSNGKPVVALGGGFWHRMLLQCVSELEQLPPLMSAAYLRSNEAQRARWASVFKHRGMYALRARVVMAGAPDPAPEINLYGHGQLFIDFMRGEERTTDFENTINKWIEEGWQFDWLLGAIFRNNVAKLSDPWLSAPWFSEHSEQPTEFLSSLFPRMEMLLRHGINPVIASDDLYLAIPEVRLMELNDHFKLEGLSRSIQFIIDNKIKIQFDNGESTLNTNPSISTIMMKIGNEYVDLPYAIERWEHELKPDSSQQLRDTEHFRRYKKTVPQLLVRLVMHLAQSHGSNAWEAARDNTMSHFLNGGYLFFTEEHESAFRMALFDTGAIFKTAEQREWHPVDHYDDVVERMVSGPSKSFITRMQELLDQNKKPVLNSRDLNLLIPNVRRMKLKDHEQLEFLSNNIKFIVDKKIKIVFDSHPHTSENPSVRMIMQAIVNAYVDLPYVIYNWEEETSWPGFDREKIDRDILHTVLHSFKETVPQRLADLMVHLAQVHGSNAWRAACDNTVSHFLNGGYLFLKPDQEAAFKSVLFKHFILESPLQWLPLGHRAPYHVPIFL